jgi:hypothetical protein
MAHLTLQCCQCEGHLPATGSHPTSSALTPSTTQQHSCCCAQLDGVTQGCAGAVHLQQVHVSRGQGACREGLADDCLLAGAIGGGEAAGPGDIKGRQGALE